MSASGLGGVCPPRPEAEDTPMGRHPPRQTPPTQCMLGYGQQAGGTHPTGMYSCFELFNHASFYDVIFSTLNAKPMNFTKSCQIILQEHLLVLNDVLTITKMDCNHSLFSFIPPKYLCSLISCFNFFPSNYKIHNASDVKSSTSQWILFFRKHYVNLYIPKQCDTVFMCTIFQLLLTQVYCI